MTIIEGMIIPNDLIKEVKAYLQNHQKLLAVKVIKLTLGISLIKAAKIFNGLNLGKTIVIVNGQIAPEDTICDDAFLYG